MGKIKYYIKSLRLRTLPLSLAGVLLGILLATADFQVQPWTAFWIIFTTICLQITANLANELGDAIKGTDRASRQGPQYSLSSGGLTKSEVKMMIFLFAILSVVSGLVMLKVSFGTLFLLEPICFILLGAASVIAALRYTLGRNPYGYRGLGDLYVFLFFGIVAVLGSYFVSSHAINNWIVVLPAVSIGCFSMGVLNVNNIRDMETDRLTRVTIPIKIGLKNARIYQTILILLGWVCMLVFTSLRMFDPWHYLFVLTAPLFIIHLKGVWTRTNRELDSMLPLLVMSSFLFSLLAGFGFIRFLLF